MKRALFHLLFGLLVLLSLATCTGPKAVTTTKTTVTTTTLPVTVPADSGAALLGPVNTPRLDSLDAAALASDLDSTFTGYQRRAVGRAVLRLLATRVRWGSTDTARVDTAGVRAIVYRDQPTGRLRTVILRKTITVPGKTIVRTDSVTVVRPCPAPDPTAQAILNAWRWAPLPGHGWRGAVGAAGLLVLVLLFLAVGRFLPR